MENIPNHVAIIMDGNGRWAQKRGLKRSFGHKKGSENLEKLCNHIFNLGIKYLSVYAFSTENFKRDKDEVDYLMNLFVSDFKKYMKKNEDAKIVFSGRRDKLPNDVLETIDKITDETKNKTGQILNVCINFGGQSDIVDASKKIALDVKNGLIDINSIDEKLFETYLYNSIPAIDLLIRTSGEERISNFMLYQSAYAEMYFPKTLFPDFDKKEFDLALEAYNNRDRRFGGIKYDKKNN